MKLFFVIMAALSQIGHFSSALSSDTKSVTRIYFFFNFAIIISRREIKKNSTVGRFSRERP